MNLNPAAQPEGGYNAPDRDGSITGGNLPPEQTGQARPANPLPGAKNIADPSLAVPKVPTSSKTKPYTGLISWVSGKLNRGYGGYGPNAGQ